MIRNLEVTLRVAVELDKLDLEGYADFDPSAFGAEIADQTSVWGVDGAELVGVKVVA